MLGGLHGVVRYAKSTFSCRHMHLSINVSHHTPPRNCKPYTIILNAISHRTGYTVQCHRIFRTLEGYSNRKDHRNPSSCSIVDTFLSARSAFLHHLCFAHDLFPQTHTITTRYFLTLTPRKKSVVGQNNETRCDNGSG